MPQPFAPKTSLLQQQVAMSAPPPGYSVAGVRTYPNNNFDTPVTSAGLKWAGHPGRQSDQRPPHFGQPPLNRHNNNLVAVPTQEAVRNTGLFAICW